MKKLLLLVLIYSPIFAGYDAKALFNFAIKDVKPEDKNQSQQDIVDQIIKNGKLDMSKGLYPQLYKKAFGKDYVAPKEEGGKSAEEIWKEAKVKVDDATAKMSALFDKNSGVDYGLQAIDVVKQDDIGGKAALAKIGQQFIDASK